MTDSWCPLPWLSQNIRNNGDMRLCDHSHHGQGNGLIRRDDGTVYNAMTDDISEARNSDLLRSVRLSMLRGEWHPTCKRCMDESRSGIPSRNENERRLWSEYMDPELAAQVTSSDGTIDLSLSPIRHYGVRFGNKCNQKCRSCGPSESDFWYEDYAKVWETDVYKDGNDVVRLVAGHDGRLGPDRDLYAWYESDRFWDHVRANAHNIRMIHMVGGEPMLIEQQYRFMALCIDMGIAQDIVVEYNSNILKIPPKAWEYWRYFKEVRIGASIDGIGQVNDYIRNPSRWSAIVDHLDRFDSDDTINFNVWIASTVMTYNVWFMPEMLEWFLERRYRRIGWTQGSPLLFFHPLYRPSFLCARSLPRDVREMVCSKFRDWKPNLVAKAMDAYADNANRREFMSEGIGKQLDRWSRWLMESDVDGPMEKFWRYTDRLDAIRGESMHQVMPEWHDIIRSNT